MSEIKMVFLGVKKPKEKYQRLRVESNFENANDLKSFYSKLTNFAFGVDEIDLSYCGDILEDNVPLKEYGIETGSTIHVLRKIEPIPAPKEYPKFTESDVQRVVSLYRSVTATGFHKISQKEVFKQILDTHPEIRNDLVAVASLRDPIILATMQNPETVRRFGKNHRSLIEASETIVKILKAKSQTLVKEPVSVETAGDDQLSDSSSSSGSENGPATSRRGQGALRRVTNEQLAAALREFAGSNSLANIAERNINSQPSGTAPSATAPSTSSNSRNQITSSMFMNALTEVLMNTGRVRRPDGTVESQPTAPANDPPENPPAPAVNEDISMDDPDAQMIASFQSQLLAMQEMGLLNKSANVQALMLCNGNLEEAVNLVLSEMNNP